MSHIHKSSRHNTKHIHQPTKKEGTTRKFSVPRYRHRFKRKFFHKFGPKHTLKKPIHVSGALAGDIKGKVAGYAYKERYFIRDGKEGPISQFSGEIDPHARGTTEGLRGAFVATLKPKIEISKKVRQTKRYIAIHRKRDKYGHFI